MTDEKDATHEKIVSILRSHGVKMIGIFGSCVRGNMGPESDIDISCRVLGEKEPA